MCALFHFILSFAFILNFVYWLWLFFTWFCFENISILDQDSNPLPQNTITQKPYVPPQPVAPANPSPGIYPNIRDRDPVPSVPGYNPNVNPDPYNNPSRNPYGNYPDGNRDRDPYNKKGSSSSDDSGSSLSGLLNFLRGSGDRGNTNTRYGSGSGSGSDGLSYGDIFNALSGGGSNRGKNKNIIQFFIFKNSFHFDGTIEYFILFLIMFYQISSIMFFIMN